MTVDLDLLARLSNALGVAGAERDVRQIVREAIKERVTDVSVDAVGNLLARRPGTGDSRLRVMLTAHLDEPGFMVSEVNDGGLISVMSVGKHDLRYLPGKRVLVGAAKTPGVILFAPIHKRHGKNGMLDVDDLKIDTGAAGKAAARIGDRVGFAGNFGKLNEQILRGKAFASRAGCAVLAALINDEPFPFDLQVAFTTQYTIGVHGAAVAANRIRPQFGIAFGGMEADDLPRLPEQDDKAAVVRLGDGPALNLRARTDVRSRAAVDLVAQAAQRHALPYQFDLSNTPVAASEIQNAAAGCLAVNIGVPVRYMGSPSELIHVDDLNNMLNLSRAFLRELRPESLEPHHE